MSQKTECYGLSGRMDRILATDTGITVRGGAPGQAFKPCNEGLVRLQPQQLPVTLMGGSLDTETVNSQWA